MNLKSRGLFLLILALGSCLILGVAFAQSEDRSYFPQTGHWVAGDFLRTYQEAKDPAKLYGYPITDEFSVLFADQEVTYQYFDRARFELRPENPPELRVVVAPLGAYLYNLDQATMQSGSQNDPHCRQFVETGQQVCASFLKFFEEYGGVAQFGYPISPVELQGDLRVQYFQRARFEWHPELPLGEQVTLTDVGRIYFQMEEDPALVFAKNNILHPVLSLNVQAFVDSAVMAPSGSQTVYVSVLDQSYTPVADVDLSFIVRSSSGQEQQFDMPATDENGISIRQIDLQGQPYGITEITIYAKFEDLEKQTLTSYRVWW